MTPRILWPALLLALASGARAADYAKDPVLMVHGYFLPDFATWASIEAKLIDDGWPPEYLFGQTFDSVVGCNPNHAEAIAESVQMIREATGRDRVDLVAHSMGALDCRYYIKYLCGYRYVKDVVMLAGANHGSVMACLEPFSCGAEQMCIGLGDEAWKDNPFLADLNACDETPGDDLRYTSIWTEFDEIIVPQEGSILPGALNHELDSFAEHGAILLNDEAYQWVKTGLNGGGLNEVLPDGAGPCVIPCEEPPEPSPEPVEPPPDVLEAPPEVLETDSEEVEAYSDPRDGPSSPDPDRTGETPPLHPAEVGAGDGAAAAADPSPDTPAADLPVHLLPAYSGGCT
ncbi:MAG: hypothetical protein FJ098_10935, partial [Deltaproteobacteria bacterium]|nr:hypothetical protein [Deltaproteobacteria bacterium]